MSKSTPASKAKEKCVLNTPKIGANEEPVYANMYTTTFSPNDSNTVYIKYKIYDDNNHIKIKPNDFIDIGSLLKDECVVTFLIQPHKCKNVGQNTTAEPAIVVEFILADDNTIDIDVMYSQLGKEFDEEDIEKRFSLIMDEELFFNYHTAASNTLAVEDSLKIKAKNKKRIVLKRNTDEN